MDVIKERSFIHPVSRHTLIIGFARTKYGKYLNPVLPEHAKRNEEKMVKFRKEHLKNAQHSKTHNSTQLGEKRGAKLKQS